MSETSLVLLSALVGALATLFVQNKWEYLKAHHFIRSKLNLVADQLEPDGHLNLRVVNGSHYCLEGCIGYLTIQDDKKDRLPKIGGLLPVIGPENSNGLCEDRLCWALMNADKTRSVALNICPKERQSLSLLRWPRASNGGREDHFFVPTEIGDSPPRICLKSGKKYLGRLKLVASNMVAKEWDIVIDVCNTTSPVSVIPRSALDFWD